MYTNFITRQVFWHSSSHLLGYAIEQLYGTEVSVQLYNGPPIDEGNISIYQITFNRSLIVRLLLIMFYMDMKCFAGGFFYDADLTSKTVKQVSCNILLLQLKNDIKNASSLFLGGLAEIRHNYGFFSERKCSF